MRAEYVHFIAVGAFELDSLKADIRAAVELEQRLGGRQVYCEVVRALAVKRNIVQLIAVGGYVVFAGSIERLEHIVKIPACALSAAVFTHHREERLIFQTYHAVLIIDRFDVAELIGPVVESAHLRDKRILHDRNLALAVYHRVLTRVLVGREHIEVGTALDIIESGFRQTRTVQHFTVGSERSVGLELRKL